MILIKDQQFGGERPLFQTHDALLDHITVVDGESAVKCCSHVECRDSSFHGKYPWWQVDGSVITRCYFAPGSRSAIWYSNDMTMTDCVIDGPKFFREMNHLRVENVRVNDADETFWKVKDLRVKDVTLRQGTYPFMFCEDVFVDGLVSDSNYVFQYCKNVELHHAKIDTKDAFWECENVTIYDSELSGKYLAWHSDNVRLVNCHVSGEQPLCYAHRLVLERCSFDVACDRAFEDSDVRADIVGGITNIKNPRTGHIVADSIGSVTIDDNVLAPNDCVVEERKTRQDEV